MSSFLCYVVGIIKSSPIGDPLERQASVSLDVLQGVLELTDEELAADRGNRPDNPIVPLAYDAPPSPAMQQLTHLMCSSKLLNHVRLKVFLCAEVFAEYGQVFELWRLQSH